MAEYIFTRKIVNNTYNIDNVLRVDGGLNQIHLAKEVEAALPGKRFILRCNGTEAKFIFEGTLTGGQQTILGNAVTAHKDNT